MKVLVTGAAGFIGSQVVRDLVAHGHEAIASVRPQTSLWRLDGVRDSVRVVEGLGDSRPDACIHLAWYAVPGRYLDAGPENIASLQESLRTLDELAAAGCSQVVMAGTCAEYDTEAGVLSEASPTRPATMYAACKLACALIGAPRAEQLGLRFAWARLFFLYGPYEDGRRLVPSIVNSILDGREFDASAGTQVRDYLHVEDVARALCALAESGGSGIFNVCSGTPTTMAALMTAAATEAGNASLLHLGAKPPRAWEPPSIVGDSTRLRSATGWTPSHALAEGMRDTVAWWKQFRAAVASP